MKLKNILKRDIERHIEAVIKLEDKKNYIELDEYVITKEIYLCLEEFLNSFYSQKATENIGVWISGFFGSGKSHFLKILSYLISNETFNEKKVCDILKDKLSEKKSDIFDLLLKMNNETILFNIDSESIINKNNEKEPIVKIFRKVFHKHLGLYGDDELITELEYYLWEKNKFEDFKIKYYELTKEDWEKRGRNDFYFNKPLIKKILGKVLNLSKEAEDQFKFEDIEKQLSIKSFSYELKNFVEKKDKNFKLVFLVDEIGQYIGNDLNTMLNLQTLIEEISINCQGKCWVIVTAQEDLKKMTSKQNQDFSKIQSRFKLRFTFSSIDVGEIIKKRILEKKEEVNDVLIKTFKETKVSLKNLFEFKDSNKLYNDNFNSKNDFVNFFPFVSYQVILLQKIFEEIKFHNVSEKYFSHGERSMISAFQDALIKFKDKDILSFVPFYVFFDYIEKFLNSSIKAVFKNLQKHSEITDFDIVVLKAVFLLKYVRDIPSTVQNIAILVIEDIYQDKFELKNKVKDSLERLSDLIFVEKNGEEFNFLDLNEQNMIREIKKIKIEKEIIEKEIEKIVFEDIFQNKKIKYKKNYEFSYNKFINDISHNLKAEISICLINFDISKEELLKKSMKHPSTLFVNMDKNYNFYDEIENYLKIEKYILIKDHKKINSELQSFFSQKYDELIVRKNRVLSYIEKSIKNSDFYINGENINVSGSFAKEKMKKAFFILIEDVYSHLSDIEENLSKNDLLEYLKSNLMINKNSKSVEDMAKFIKINFKDEKFPLFLIVERYSKKPYGWSVYDVIFCLLTLYKENKISFDIDIEKDFEKLFLKKEHKNIFIRKVKIFSTYEKNDLKILFHELTNETVNIENESNLKEIFINLFQTILDNLEENRNKAKKFNYPGIKFLNNSIDIFSDILKESEKETFLKLICDKKEIILKWKDDSEIILDFFKENNYLKKIFDKGKDLYETINEIEDFVNVNFIKKEIEILKEILEDEAPYKRIREINMLKQNIDDFIDKEVLSIKKLTLDTLCSKKEKILSKLNNKEKVEITENFFKNLHEKIEKCDNIIKIRAFLSIILEIEKKYMDDSM